MGDEATKRFLQDTVNNRSFLIRGQVIRFNCRKMHKPCLWIPLDQQVPKPQICVGAMCWVNTIVYLLCPCTTCCKKSLPVCC